MKIGRFLSFLVLACVLCACDAPENKAERFVRRGDARFDKGEYGKARLDYKNAARLRPTDADILYRLALTNEAEGDLASAFSGFLASAQQDSSFGPAALKLAHYYLAGGNYGESARRLDEALETNPKNAKALSLRAALLARLGDQEGAHQAARAALAIDPRQTGAYAALAGLALERNELDAALSIVNRGLSEKPDALDLLVLKGDLLERRGAAEAVLETYRQIFRIRPKEVKFRNDLADYLVKKGKIEEAEKILRESVSALPDEPAPRRKLLFFLGKNRGLEEAEKQAHFFYERFADDEALFALAQLHAARKDYATAIARLQPVVRGAREAASFRARGLIAAMIAAQGDTQGARDMVETLLHERPEDPDLLLLRARFDFERGNLGKSVDDLRIIVRDRPTALPALELLARALAFQGHIAEAIDVQMRLVDAAPTNLEAKIGLARLRALYGDVRGSLALLESVTQAEPSHRAAQEALARAAIAAKNWDKANKAIDALGDLDPQEHLPSLLRAFLLIAQEREKEALPLLEDTLVRGTDKRAKEQALAAYLDASRRAGRRKEAERFVTFLPNKTSYALTLLGGLHAARGDARGAAECFDKALARGANEAAPFLARAEIHMRDGEVEDALSLLHRAEKSFSVDARPALMRAEYLQSLGRTDDAIAAYETALSRAPDFAVAANNLAQLLADAKADDPKALARAKELAERFIGSSDPFLLDTLAWVFFRQGNAEQALTIMDRVAALAPHAVPQIQYHRGAILAAMKKNDEAMKALDEATRAGIEYQGVHDAHLLLERLRKKQSTTF